MGTKKLQKRVTEFSEACRRYGVKATYQRREFYRELAGMNEHPDAEGIYVKVCKRIPEISLDTMYRTFHLPENKGLIARLPNIYLLDCAVCPRVRCHNSFAFKEITER